MIDVSNLEFAYTSTGFRLSIEKFSVASGERVAMIGPSGSGKSTLLSLLAGILTPALGEIVVAGRNLAELHAAARRDFRIATMGLVFQSFELLEYLTVRDNLLLPYRVNSSLKLTADVRQRAEQLAAELEIADKLKRFPGQLSQGERQRVAIGRALVTSPPLMLADEPTGNLDPRTKAHVLDLLLQQAADRGMTFLMVTHDHAQLARFEKTYDISEFHGAAAAASPGGPS